MSRISLRRLRQDPHIRALTREARPHPEQFIQPLFVVEGIAAAGDDSRASQGFTVTPRPRCWPRSRRTSRPASASSCCSASRPQHRLKAIDWSFTSGQVAALKKRFGKDIWLAVDVCLCSSTPHGHCGVLNDNGDHVDNARQRRGTGCRGALAYADAGADCVAPSDMMDGRIGAIRSDARRATVTSAPC